MNKTRIVHISDTHGHEPALPTGDILIHSGDGLSRGTIQELVRLNKWFQKILPNFERIFYIAGNHDRIFQESPGIARSILSAATVLIDEEATFNGIKIYGSPYTPAFCNWSFQLYGDDAKKCWAKIPTDVDVLVTHGPPQGILDLVDGGENVGCPELLKRVMDIKPAYHLFGHIHEAYGQKLFNGVTFFNSSICCESYRNSNSPQVIEIEK